MSNVGTRRVPPPRTRADVQYATVAFGQERVREGANVGVCQTSQPFAAPRVLWLRCQRLRQLRTVSEPKSSRLVTTSQSASQSVQTMSLVEYDWHSHWLLLLLLPLLYLAGLNKRLRLLAGCEQTPTLSITRAGQQMTQTRHLPFND